MKKYLILIFILVGTLAVAQPPQGNAKEDRNSKKERIHALAVAYITEQLELTPNEAAQFWPVINELRDQRHQLERKKKSLIRKMDDKLETLNDQQAVAYIAQIVEIETQVHQFSYEQNSTKIIKIIGAKRFLKLMKAEADFRRKMLREYKERRGRGRP